MRDHLAVAKLEPVVQSSTREQDLPCIVLSHGDSPDAEFVEVHIYERLDRYSIERVMLDVHGTEDDEVMKLLVIRDCQRLGIPYGELD
jgi:hypothetical protein